MTTGGLDAHFFRREYGKLVATLSRRVGVQHLAEIEDAAQTALMRALERWRVDGLPDNPSAWLFRVANNALLGALRKSAGQRRVLEARGQDVRGEAAEAQAYLAGEAEDDLLRMLFVCCDETIPVASQLVLALKTLCGFDAREIALRLFTSEANVYKRLARARERLRQQGRALTELDTSRYPERLPAVRGVLYQLFTEGHLSSHAQLTIRRELCDEAIRLTHLLAEHPAGAAPETYALLALMHLHAARLDARTDEAGGLLLLEEQDRARWDLREIEGGLEWLARSAEGETLSRYHVEAGIAAEHCMAPSFEETRWQRVAERYALLERLAPSPLHRLNRALAVAEARGPDAGLEVLEGAQPPTWLLGSYMWSAVAADLHRRAGHEREAARFRRMALESAPTEAVRASLRRRLEA